MDRGEPLPDWVVGYQDGVRYHDVATRAQAREQAIRVVDGRRGYSLEFASDPAAHQLDYDEEQARILDDIARQSDLSRGRTPGTG